MQLGRPWAWLNGAMARHSDQRALVTGGTSGIGEAIVTRLASDGARVVFTGRDEARGAAVAQATGGEFVRADVRDAGAVRASVRDAVARLGGLEIAVLNAGVLCEATLSETTDEQWDTVMSTNLEAPFRYAREVLPALRESGGSLVLVASDAGVWGETPIGAYSVSKRAVIMLTRMLAVEAGPDGVRVNAVCPGDTEPGMVTTVGGRTRCPTPRSGRARRSAGSCTPAMSPPPSPSWPATRRARSRARIC